MEKKELKATLSERNGKPYIVIDDMGQGGKTVFAGTMEHIQINDLSTPSVRGEEIENIKRRAVLDYILSLGWQDTENEYVKEVLEDAERIAVKLSPQTTEGESK